jgi:hypothetical protein
MSRRGKCTRREGGAGVGGAARLLAAAFVLGACADVEMLVEADPAARFPGPPGEPAALLAGPGDTIWALAGDSLWSFVPGEAPRARGTSPPAARLVGAGEERIYLAAAGRLHAFSPADDSVRAVSRASGSAAALDPRGRNLLLAGARGEVMGLTPRALLSSWAWPRQGTRSAAVVVSPDGSRVYHALHAEGEHVASRILTRDFQTGRVLGEIELRGWTRAAAIGAGGELLLLQGREEGADLVALRPLGGRMHPLWRRELGEIDLPGADQLAAAGDRLWVGEMGRGTGRVLDRATGDVVAGTRFPPGGVAVAAPGGRVWVLSAGELLRYDLEGLP